VPASPFHARCGIHALKPPPPLSNHRCAWLAHFIKQRTGIRRILQQTAVAAAAKFSKKTPSLPAPEIRSPTALTEISRGNRKQDSRTAEEGEGAGAPVKERSREASSGLEDEPAADSFMRRSICSATDGGTRRMNCSSIGSYSAGNRSHSQEDSSTGKFEGSFSWRAPRWWTQDAEWWVRLTDNAAGCGPGPPACELRGVNLGLG
jgi:hypothetical protein